MHGNETCGNCYFAVKGESESGQMEDSLYCMAEPPMLILTEDGFVAGPRGVEVESNEPACIHWRPNLSA